MHQRQGNTWFNRESGFVFWFCSLKTSENNSVGQLCVIDNSNKGFNSPHMKDTLNLGNNFSLSFSDSVYPKVCYLSLTIP